jgi:hypothetical protein
MNGGPRASLPLAQRRRGVSSVVKGPAWTSGWLFEASVPGSAWLLASGGFRF